MSLKWNTTEVKSPGVIYTVTHQPQHDPHKLVESLQTPPNKIIGDFPSVKVHRFGRRSIVVRTYPYHRGFSSEHDMDYDAEKSFSALSTAAKRGVKITEVPVALVRAHGQYHIVTRWVENPRSLSQFLGSRSVSSNTKFSTCLKVAELIGQMHAAKLVHRDLYKHGAINFVIVDKKGNPTLIDPTSLDYFRGSGSADAGEKIWLPLAKLYKQSVKSNESAKNIAAAFKREHAKAHQQYTKIFEKRDSAEIDKTLRGRLKEHLAHRRLEK